MAEIPVFAEDDNITEGLESLQELGENGIQQMRMTMSVLVYRLSKILCNPDQKGGTSWFDTHLNPPVYCFTTRV